MKITVNTQDLAQELRLLNTIVPNKHAIPILMSVLFDAGFEGLRLAADNHELNIITTCPAQVEETGKAALPAKRLLDIIDQLPNAAVSLEVKGLNALLQCGSFRSKLQLMDAEDFRPLAPLPAQIEPVPGLELQALIRRVRYAIADKDRKYTIGGALLSFVPNGAVMVSTDGKRLSVATMARQGTGEATAIVPEACLDAVDKVLSGPQFSFAHSENQLFFHDGRRTVASRMLSGQFPAYQRIIPQTSTYHVHIDRVLFAAALRRCGLLSEDNQAVRLTFEANALLVQAQAAGAGEAIEHIVCDYTRPGIQLCACYTYLLDFLDVAEGVTIELSFETPEKPLLLSDGASFINVVMLMRAS